jgi:hypothetical protein
MLKTYLFFSAFLVWSIACFSQETIRGVVVDDQNTPIFNAHVYWTGIPVGVITDLEGRFELHSEADFKSFEVSFVGMQTAVVPLQKNKEFYEIVLQENDALNEVVVVSKPKKKAEKK